MKLTQDTKNMVEAQKNSTNEKENSQNKVTGKQKDSKRLVKESGDKFKRKE